MHSLKEIVHAALAGELSSAEVSELARDHWDRGDFVHHVDGKDLLAVEPAGPSVPRYSGAETVRHWRMYGEPGSVGCVLVRCPHDARYRGDLRELQVPPHTHSTDHIAIVLDGGGSFVVARPLGGVPRVIVAEAKPGMVGFYPSGVPHTFVSGPEGILVASLQSEFQAPESEEFATPVEDALHALEHVGFDGWLSSGPAASARSEMQDLG